MKSTPSLFVVDYSPVSVLFEFIPDQSRPKLILGEINGLLGKSSPETIDGLFGLKIVL